MSAPGHHHQVHALGAVAGDGAPPFHVRGDWPDRDGDLLARGHPPGLRAIGEADEMEEERRLCYVAITRAKEKLTITHAKQRMLYGRTNAALPSRFLREIPDDLLLHKGGYYSSNQRSSTAATATGYDYARPSKSYLAARETKTFGTQTAAAIPELNKGDMVQHTAFGRGMVLSVMKMGGDALLEIAFDEIGTKKLMAKAAAAHMKRL